MKYLRRGSGYYIDVGASQLIIDGKIRLAHGNAAEITENAVVPEDGTMLPADVIVYATGHGSMNGWPADLIGKDVADKVGKCRGLGSNITKDPGPWVGEQRNMWKPTRRPGLWFHGGNLHRSRHYSQILSLQLKARMEGMPPRSTASPTPICRAERADQNTGGVLNPSLPSEPGQPCLQRASAGGAPVPGRGLDRGLDRRLDRGPDRAGSPGNRTVGQRGDPGAARGTVGGLTGWGGALGGFTPPRSLGAVHQAFSPRGIFGDR